MSAITCRCLKWRYLTCGVSLPTYSEDIVLNFVETTPRGQGETDPDDKEVEGKILKK